jgi:hypothetical protein
MDNTTLDDILVTHKDDEEMGGIQMPSWFGENLLENRTLSELVIDSVWRRPTGYGGQTAKGPLQGFGREKLIVRPCRIVYFGCHIIILGGSMIPEPRIRMNHYKKCGKGALNYLKRCDNGVYGLRRPWILHKDESLANAYGPKLRQQRLGLPQLGSSSEK